MEKKGNGHGPKWLIRSTDASSNSTSSSNFQVTLNRSMPGGRYALKHVSLPNTIYNCDTFNNILNFRENSTNKQATISAGSYVPSTLATAVQSALNTASGGYNTYAVSYSTNQQGFTFSAGNNFQFMYGSNNTSSVSNLNAKLLGFSKVDTTAATSLTSPNVANLQFPSSLFIRVDSNNEIWSSANNSVGGSFYFPLNGLQCGDWCYFYEATSFKQTCYIISTSTPTIQLITAEGINVNLRGADWEFMLELVS